MNVEVTLSGQQLAVNIALLRMIAALADWRPELTSIADGDDRGETRIAKLSLGISQEELTR